MSELASRHDETGEKRAQRNRDAGVGRGPGDAETDHRDGKHKDVPLARAGSGTKQRRSDETCDGKGADAVRACLRLIEIAASFDGQTV